MPIQILSNVPFRILEESIWLQLTYFLATIAFWLVNYLFPTDGDTLKIALQGFTVCGIYRSNQPLWKIHGIR